MFCQKCGKELPDEAKFCQYCGWQNQGTPVKQREQKSQFVAIVLCLFLGLIGIHDFYLERNGAGVAKLLIAILLGWMAGIGIFVNGIWCIIDFICILCKGFDCLLTDEEIKQKEIQRYNDTHYYKKEDERPTAEILAEKENKQYGKKLL